MAIVLTVLFAQIRTLAIAIQPVVPAAAAFLLDQMGIPDDERDFAALEDVDWIVRLAQSEYRVPAPVGIFPRLDMPSEVLEATA